MRFLLCLCIMPTGFVFAEYNYGRFIYIQICEEECSHDSTMKNVSFKFKMESVLENFIFIFKKYSSDLWNLKLLNNQILLSFYLQLHKFSFNYFSYLCFVAFSFADFSFQFSKTNFPFFSKSVISDKKQKVSDWERNVMNITKILTGFPMKWILENLFKKFYPLELIILKYEENFCK